MKCCRKPAKDAAVNTGVDEELGGADSSLNIQHLDDNGVSTR
jgi:hypothetical protein